jgi:homoserine dehydrogenase
VKVSEIGCGLVGCGTVGSGVVRLWRAAGGAPPAAALEAVAVRRLDKRRAVDLSGVRLTDDALSVARDPRVRLVIEATGDTEAAYAVACEALARGKAFVTASKALVAAHGPELEELAAVQEVPFAYEAAVGGALPIVALLRQGISPGALAGFSAVLNGTSNFVLCRLAAGVPFDQALAAARCAGLAEADTSRDTGGLDTADKLRILARLCGFALERTAVPVTGIDGLRPADAAFGRARGRVARLVGTFRIEGEDAEAHVEPAFVPEDSPLAAARDEDNVVVLDLGAAGPLAVSARGAGSLPSASAVLADVRAVVAGGLHDPRRHVPPRPVKRVLAAAAAPYYVRLEAPGQAALARRRLSRALAIAGIGASVTTECGRVQALTSPASGELVRRTLARLPWAGVALALREGHVQARTEKTARIAGGRRA